MQGRTILSIDPEGENNKLCEAMGGTVIPAGAPGDPDTCLLHPLQAESPQDMLLAARFFNGNPGRPRRDDPGNAGSPARSGQATLGTYPWQHVHCGFGGYIGNPE